MTTPRSSLRLLASAAVLLTFAGGCGSDETAQELRRQNDLEQARQDAERSARQDRRIEDLERTVARQAKRKRARRKRAERVVPAAATSAPAAATDADVAEVQTQAVEAFQTGTDPDKSLPAAYCRITSEVYCWTPNDGYTVRLGSGAPFRDKSAEAANKNHLPSGYDVLSPGESRSANGFRCTSRESGLSCVSSGGHGWTLPRYVGLPTLY